MRKVLLILAFFGFLFVSKGHAVYFDVYVQEVPAYLFGFDYDGNSFGSFFNIANIGGSFHVNDQMAAHFRLKDTFLTIPTTNDISSNENRLYIDRLNFQYESDILDLKIGRAAFVEGSAMLIGNVSDGLYARVSFLGINTKLYLLYSGLLPDDVNAFNANSVEQVEGANRLVSGLVLQGYGFLIEEMDLKFMYSKDFATNSLTNAYSPLYLSYAGNAVIGSRLNLAYNLVYGFGMRGSDIVSAYAGEFSMMLVGSGGLAGLLAQVSVASGEKDGGAYNGFRSFGVYDTGFVMVPKFSNLLMVKLSLAARSANDAVAFSLNYYNMSRLSTNDTVDGYFDGEGTALGNEISGGFVYQFDPNLAIFVNAGIFLKGEAFSSLDNIYKIIGGAKIEF